MIEALSHLTFIVKDLERTGRFFQDIFDAEEVYDNAERNFSISREKFFLIGDVWIAILEGDPKTKRSYNHVAFKIPETAFETYMARLTRTGVEILPGRSRVDGEGRSIYFYDYDNHLFELHTGTLDQRLARYKREK